MVMVRSVREHSNSYGVEHGVKIKKTVGTEYDLPESMVPTLTAAGLVAEVAADDGGLSKLGKAELEAIATQEGVEVASGATKAQLVDAITAHRQPA